MIDTYFASGDAWKRFAFVEGYTADEFYTNSGLRLNIEQLLHLELRRIGYQRVVFYSEHKGFYCFDDASFALLSIPEPMRPTRLDSREHL